MTILLQKKAANLTLFSTSFKWMMSVFFSVRVKLESSSFRIVQFQKILILPHRRDSMEFPWEGGGGFCTAKKSKEMYEA